LVVEDDAADRLALRLHLELMGFAVHGTASPSEALEAFETNVFNLVIIHLGFLPLRGLELCRHIRAASTVPILMLTQRDQLVTEQMCLHAGADDYITKPFEARILTSRITQQLKRGQSQREPFSNLISWGPLTLDLAKHTLVIHDQTVTLTSSEFQFLQLLMEDPHRVYSRNQILDAIGVMKGVGTGHIVDSHASRLRLKIKAAGGPKVINVVRSVGFRLAESDVSELS
jgi:DNA-binding response OmpR family regulator